MRYNPKNDITLDAIVGRLIAFELDNYDNYVPNSRNLESSFEAKLSLKKKGKKANKLMMNKKIVLAMNLKL